MNLNRRTSEAQSTENVHVSARIDGYEATRPPAGVVATGLPRAQRPAESVAPAVPEPAAPARPELRPVSDRRGEERTPVRIGVRATHPAGDVPVTGITIDISLGGVSLQMPTPPPAAFVDLAVGDGSNASTVWASVLDGKPVAEGGFQWRLRVLAADRRWERLVRQLELGATTSAQPRLRSVS
jgi:hypothetical protein